MDHGYTERQCPHDKCLNHNPEFGNIREEITDAKPSRLFKILTYFKYFCCKKKMKMQQINSFQACKACGRRKVGLFNYYYLLCECCGYHSSINGVKEISEKFELPLFMLTFMSFVFLFSFMVAGWFWLAGLGFVIFVFSITLLVASDNIKYKLLFCSK